MSRAVAYAALLAISLAAGAWLYSTSRQPYAPDLERHVAGSCEQGEVCSAGTIPRAAETGEQHVEPPPSAGAAPPAAAPPVAEATPPAAPANAVELREKADRLLAERKILEGLAALREATEADPSARNHADLGKLLERLMMRTEALIHLRAAAEADPNNADHWIDLANAYYRRVDLGEAWKAERRAKEAEPGLVLGRDASGMRIRAPQNAPERAPERAPAARGD